MPRSLPTRFAARDDLWDSLQAVQFEHSRVPLWDRMESCEPNVIRLSRQSRHKRLEGRPTSRVHSWLALLFFFSYSAVAQNRVQQVAAVLDDWHQAASVADEARYFSHFAANGIFMGTDATERWTVAEFRAWAHPHFQRKSAWSFKPHHRHIDFSSDGHTAWFDELLATPNLGPCRGSGVLIRDGNSWKIAQYNLSIPIPNDLADGVVKEIAKHRHN